MTDPHEVTPAEFLEKAIKSFEAEGVKAFEVGAVILLVNGDLRVVSVPLTPTEFLAWLETRIIKPKEVE